MWIKDRVVCDEDPGFPQHIEPMLIDSNEHSTNFLFKSLNDRNKGKKEKKNRSYRTYRGSEEHQIYWELLGSRYLFSINQSIDSLITVAASEWSGCQPSSSCISLVSNILLAL